MECWYSMYQWFVEMPHIWLVRQRCKHKDVFKEPLWSWHRSPCVHQPTPTDVSTASIDSSVSGTEGHRGHQLIIRGHGGDISWWPVENDRGANTDSYTLHSFVSLILVDVKSPNVRCQMEDDGRFQRELMFCLINPYSVLSLLALYCTSIGQSFHQE